MRVGIILEMDSGVSIWVERLMGIERLDRTGIAPSQDVKYDLHCGSRLHTSSTLDKMEKAVFLRRTLCHLINNKNR